MKLYVRITEALFFICFGGSVYYGLEVIFRGFSHYSMFLCGGISFYLISRLNRRYSSSLHLITRMILCTFLILFMELLFGLVFNLFLHRQVWDYSSHYYHWKGQICLTYAIVWFFISCPVLYLESFFRRWLFSSDPSTLQL